MKRLYAFTLIELMVMIAIIGVLALVGIPAYREYVRYGEANQCSQVILGSRLLATQLIMNDDNIEGITAASLGLDSSDACSGGISVGSSSGRLDITGSSGDSSTGGVHTRFTLSRATDGIWSCRTVDGDGATLYTGDCTEVY